MVFEDPISYVENDFAGNRQSQPLLAKIEEAIQLLEAYFDLHLRASDSCAQLHHFVAGFMVQYVHVLFHFLYKNCSIHH